MQYKCGHCSKSISEQAKEIRVLRTPGIHGGLCVLELVSTCHKCRKRSIFQYQTSAFNRPPHHCAIDESPGWERVSQHPKPRAAKAPGHVPDRVLKYWIAARQNELDGKWEEAETTAIKTFEVLLQSIETMSGIEKKGGYEQRLETIFKNESVHPSLTAWLENLRLIRNESMHGDDDPTESDISDAIAFLEIFMIYHYTLPKRIADRQPNQV